MRSNSFSESGRVLPTSHISSRTTPSRTLASRAQNPSIVRTRSPTVIDGHAPRPYP